MEGGRIILILSAVLMFLLLVRSIMGRMMPKCPQCHKSNGMRKVNSGRVEVVVDGRPRHQIWTYFHCDNCNAYLKYHANKWSVMDDYDPELQSQDDVAIQKKRPPAK